MHGGKSLRGVAHPNFRDGRHSRDIIAGLTGRYREVLADRTRFDLTPEIALAEVYLAKTLQEGESLKMWKDAKAAHKALGRALNKGEPRAIEAARRNLREAVSRDLYDRSHRDEVMSMIETRRRLVEAEHKRRTDPRFALTCEEAMAQIAAMVDVLRKRIKDRDLLRAVTDEIDRIVRGTRGGSPRDADQN